METRLNYTFPLQITSDFKPRAAIVVTTGRQSDLFVNKAFKMKEAVTVFATNTDATWFSITAYSVLDFKPTTLSQIIGEPLAR